MAEPDTARLGVEAIWALLRKDVAPDYHFALHDAEGAVSDDLGDVQLADDNDAIEHGRHIVQDMLIDNPAQYLRWTVNITQDARVVHRLFVR